MFVETRSITIDDDGFPELTVTGKSLPEYLKYRAVGVAHTVYDKSYAMLYSYSPDKAACLLIWNAFVNPTTADVSWAGGSRATNPNIPNLVVSNSHRLGVSAARWLTPGIIYQPVMDLLALDDLGVRTIRPESYSAHVVTIQASPTRGLYSTALVPVCTDLRFDIYKGVDRSINQSTVAPVVLSSEEGHFENVEYLWSNQDFVTELNMRFEPSVDGPSGYRVFYRDGNSSVSGLTYREDSINVGSPGPGETSFDFWVAQESASETIFKERNRVSLLNFDISPDIPYVYNQHYGLGDRITIKAEYEFEQTMRVDEYVRTEDIEGERGYPGLSLIE
jgi:hypothetical protein